MQMALCWEAFSLNRQLTNLDEHSFESFRAAIIKYADANISSQGLETTPDETAISSRPSKRSTTPPSVTPPTKRKQTLPGRNISTSPSQNETPAGFDEGRRRISLSPEMPLSRTGTDLSTALYDDRKGAGKVMDTWNPNKLSDATVKHQSMNKPRCIVSSSDFSATNTKHRYRHMNTTVEEVARILDEHLVRLGEMMIEHYGLGKDGEMVEGEGSTDSIPCLEAVGVPRQETVCCIGRICNEVSTHDDHILFAFLHDDHILFALCPASQQGKAA